MELVGLAPVSAPLPWQAQPWAELNALIERNQLPHALLLVAPRHTGKERFALALARLLLCHAPVDGLNCGRCHACELSAQGSHGDMRWLSPEEKSRVIKIDQIRSVVEFGTKTAAFGRRKVIVLSPADSMNSSAANAFLKSLEEPSPDTFIVLVCHRLHGVPPTIRSRCQIRRLPTPPGKQALDWLDKVTGERDRSSQLLALAEGRPLLAEELYHSGGAELAAAVRQGVQALLAGNGASSQVAQLLAELDLEELLSRLSAELRLLLRSMPANQLGSQRGRAAFGVMDELTSIQRAVSGGANPNRQLLVDALLARLQRELGPGASGGTMRP